MINTLAYAFSELAVDCGEIQKILGYPGVLPEPFDKYLEEAWNYAGSLSGICGCYVITDKIEIGKEPAVLTAGNMTFNTGKIINHELKHSEKTAFFVATAGKDISIKSDQLMHGSDPIKGYVYDVLGSFIAEAASEKIHHTIQNLVLEENLHTTNRYSPGYCNWPLQDQHKLFSFFKENTCNVQLSESALMNPVKSVSGIIGIGKNVKFRKYQCDICTMKDCTYRDILSKY